MPTVSAEDAPGDVRAIKIAVVGNSNSVMHDGYVQALEHTPGLTVVNRSIGSSPNVVLLDFLAREPELDYDFIIVETAVVDFIQAGTLYPQERSQETLELFIGQVRATSRAQIIILTIPTRFALLAPDGYWQERLYRDTAERYGIPILDGFRLIRQLIGPAKMAAAGTYLTRAEQLVAVFGLPVNISPSLAWRELRERHIPANAVGVFGFSDHAHFSGVVHALVGSILADFIISANVSPDGRGNRDRVASPGMPPVIAVDSSGSVPRVARASSLMSRDLAALQAGETAHYQCPPGYRVYGLLVNQSKTACFLRLSSPGGDIAFDMQFGPMPFDWVGVVVPITDPVGDGLVEITVVDSPPDDLICRQLHSTDIHSAGRCAELGELIVVQRDWRDHVALPAAEQSSIRHLEDDTWARLAIEEAALRAAPMIKGIESDGRFVPSDCSAFAATLLAKSPAPLSSADQARLLLVLGMKDRLPAFLETAISQQGGDEELTKMLDMLRRPLPGAAGAVVAPQRLVVSASAVDVPADSHVKEVPQGMEPIAQESSLLMVSERPRNKPAPDAPLEAWFQAAAQADVGDSLALLEEAWERFPDTIRLAHDLARLCEKHANWQKAGTYWRRYIGLGGNQWWAHVALAAALRSQNLDAEADAALYDAVLQCPDEPNILAEIANAAERRGDFPESMRVWEIIIARFPNRWIGYRGKSRLLSRNGFPTESDGIIETHAPSLPDDIDALHDLARLAERQRDWERAEITWRSFLVVHKLSSWAYLALARALREQSHYLEAEDVLRSAQQQFPTDIDLPVEAARCAEQRNDPAEAIRHWQTVAALRPKSPRGPLGEAELLRMRDQVEAADDVILAAMKRLPDEPSLLEAYGLNAMARAAWTEALSRLETAQRRFPSNDAIRQRIFEVRLKIADEGGSAPPVEADDERDAEERALVMQFESLGGGGHGCEFGIFQRQFGAEPLGLLRWADIFQDHLSELLETEFDGIGEPQFTNIFVPDNSSDPEYWTTDSRYHMAMRSFVSVADVPLERMRQQVTKRFKYLSRKLADDLRSGTKIFVYKNMKRNLTDAELRRLHKACRRYGDNTLFYIQYEDATNPSGTVRVRDEGLLVGYIDHFSHTPDTDQYIDPNTETLLGLCRSALALWKSDQSVALNSA